MAYTGRELFERAMAVMDEISKQGLERAMRNTKPKLIVVGYMERRMAKTAGRKNL